MKTYLTLHQVAELAIEGLLRNPVSLQILKQINVLFVDEIGQISSEMLSTLDIILRRIRNSNIYLGGLLFICTLDHKQLPPIKGKPFLTSPHVLSCFEFIRLEESVRANSDSDLQRIQKIARFHPQKYIDDPTLITEFKILLSTTCTFVSDWKDPLITPTAYRLYGKKFPAKQASKMYIDQVKAQFQNHEIIERVADDVKNPHQSHQEWHLASENTSNALDNRLKEPRSILFFKGAVYEFTYNEDKKFNQSQLGLLLNIPSQADIDVFRKIPILVAPPGVKVVDFDEDKTQGDYISEGWGLQNVGMEP